MEHDRSVLEHLAWMRLRRLSQATLDLRVVALGSLRRAAGKPPDDCGPADLDRWQRGLAVCDSSRASYVSQVHAYYDWAVEHGRVGVDPSAVLVTPQLPRRVPRPISEADLELAIAAAPPRVLPWLELAAFAGLRAAEVAGLRREQVLDDAAPPVLLVVGKGRRERVVPLAPRVRAALRRHGMPSAGWVFTRRDGGSGPNRPDMVSALAAKHLHGLGIECSLHALRHRFASQLYQRTHDLRMVQDVLGHQSPATTAGYAKWAPESLAAVLDLGRMAS